MKFELPPHFYRGGKNNLRMRIDAMKQTIENIDNKIQELEDKRFIIEHEIKLFEDELRG